MIKNNFFKFLLLISICALYFFSRLQNLTSIPVFCDEGIYIRWSQIIKSEETLRFIPQTDGKQPLFMWLNAITLKFINDPLVSGRIISVFAGFGLLILLFILTALFLNYEDKEKNIFKFIKNSFSKNFYPSILTSLIYCLIPFSFFFDRMATADNLLSFFGLLALIFAFLLAKYPRLDLALILGFVLGLSWLTKSPAIYFVVLSIFTFIILNIRKLKLVYLPVISSIVAFLIYNILRLGPQFQMIALRNKDYIWSLSEVLKHPLDPLIPHLINAFDLYFNYISIPLIIFSLAGLIFYFRSSKQEVRNWKFLILIAWWILPLIANSALAKVFTARYVLFTLPPLIILISIGFYTLITKIKSNLLKTILIISVFILNINFIYNLSVNPFNQKLVSSEQGYLSDWTSGWGIKEISVYLKERAKEKNVIVGTEGYFGTLPDGLQIYTNKTSNLTIIGVGLGFSKIPSNLINAKNYGDEVYLIMNQSRLNLSQEEMNKVKIIKKYPKPNNDNLLLIQI
ncbi:MAG: glycosyltransferase family 39 protein [Candidatus Shapirobacteria bacterium]